MSASSPRRRRFGRALAEMHFQLRTEGGSAPNKGASVALGVFLGCLPVYGLHLVLCFGLARLLRLSRLRAYLAAHINNPLSGPFLVSLELAVGHRLLEGRWPDLRFTEIPSLGAIGAHLVVGSLLVGAVLGVALGLAAYLVARRWRAPGFPEELRERTAKRYLDAGIFDWEFVRGKLRWDPLYFSLLRHGLLPEGRLLDLGSGRGIVSALLTTAHEMAAEGRYPEDWAAPPEVEVLAFERNPKAVRAARRALGRPTHCESPGPRESRADSQPPQAPSVPESPPATAHRQMAQADLAAADLPPADGALLFDVLHYLPAATQEQLLHRIAIALAPGGRLVLREADAAAGLAFFWTRSAERLAALARGHWRQRFCYRSAGEWRRLLESCGFTIQDELAMAAGTPYANVLLVAQLA